MSRRLSRLLAIALLVLAPPAAADRWWIPVVAHAPGVGGSAWRSDVTVLSLCAAEGRVALRLHAGGGVLSQTVALGAWSQTTVADVVGPMGGDAVGALEIEADVPVAATSRTYDAASAQPGTVIEGVSPAELLAAGDEAFVPALAESGARRTNLGVFNAGAAPAEVDVFLADGAGRDVGRFTLVVPPAGVVQDNRPFRERFGRTDVAGGSARVRVVSGSGVWAWGSVIDQATGSALAIRARKAAAACAADVAAELARIAGVEVREETTALEGYRRFALQFLQPRDHGSTGGATFPQFVTLLHRSFGAPVVLETLGYDGGWGDRRDEPTLLLGANQVVVEHRFFGSSRPDPPDYGLLTVRQAADDVHRVVEALRGLYRARWVSAGHSKSGIAALFHRRFHADDVAGTVAYVAPNSRGAPDPRYLGSLTGIGPAACRVAVEEAQRRLLVRRDAMLVRLAALGLPLDRIGGRDAALESVALDVPFLFWQYSGAGACPGVPTALATDDALFAFAQRAVGFQTVSDTYFERFGPYFYQAASELGYPAISRENLADMLRATGDHDRGVLPPGTNATWSPAATDDLAAWIASTGSRLLFVYGGGDPWTAGAFDPGGAADAHVFVQPEGTHGAIVGSLPPEDQARAFSILGRWTGVTPQPPAPAARAALLEDLAALAAGRLVRRSDARATAGTPSGSSRSRTRPPRRSSGPTSGSRRRRAGTS